MLNSASMNEDILEVPKSELKKYNVCLRNIDSRRNHNILVDANNQEEAIKKAMATRGSGRCNYGYVSAVLMETMLNRNNH